MIDKIIIFGLGAFAGFVFCMILVVLSIED